MKTKEHTIKDDLRTILKCRYTSIGSYPMFAITDDNSALCADCLHSEFMLIARNTLQNNPKKWKDRQWSVNVIAVNWEDPNLYCSHCSQRIESAYADPD